MKLNIKLSALFLSILFILLTAGRLAYVINAKPDNQQGNYYNANYVNDKSGFSTAVPVRNYAKVMFQPQQAGGAASVGQVYEKKADLRAVTQDFTKDEKTLRGIIEANHALIQLQQLNGLDGERQLSMSIGVYPEKFDTVVEAIKALGKLSFFSVTKEDKTSEFKKLKKERESLKERIESLSKLKSRQGKIEELMALDEKIFTIMKDIHDLSLKIGEFEGVKDFCTISYTMVETKAPKKEGIGEKVADAMAWAIGQEFIIVFLLILGAGALYVCGKAYVFIRNITSPAIPVQPVEPTVMTELVDETQGKRKKAGRGK